MTARMLVSIEDVLLKEHPDAVLVYGDTNSTLAAALAAVKLNIPIYHVEAGNRMGSLESPEEVNRIVTDHLSTIAFCATENAYETMKKEGLGDKAYCIGNITYDAFLYYSGRPWKKKTLLGFHNENVEIPREYYYMTCHRQENTSDDEALKEILLAMNSLDAPTIYPVHPRNHERGKKICEENGYKNIILIQPVGYLDSIHLTKGAKRIVTDSGGLQCEAFYAEVPCVFVMNHAVWPETMVDNRNQIAKPKASDILKKLSVKQIINPEYQPFGDGHAAEKMCQIIREQCRTKE